MCEKRRRSERTGGLNKIVKSSLAQLILFTKREKRPCSISQLAKNEKNTLEHKKTIH